MKITLLAPDVSGNCMGRVAILARVLARDYPVSIVGPAFGDGVWEPLSEFALPIEAIPFGPRRRDLKRLAAVEAAIDGDVVLACKPLLTSFGVALRQRRRGGCPVVVDVDDWETGFCRDYWRRHGWPRRLRHLASSAWRPQGTLSWSNGPYWERRVAEADGVLVSNAFLQRRFGGVRVWHGRDTVAFDPRQWDGAAERAARGIAAGGPLVTFFGTPAPYKGIDDLGQALVDSRHTDARLLWIGAGQEPAARSLGERLEQRLGARLVRLGRQPLQDVPRLLSMADVVVVPQREVAATAGQMPAKLFDAMAAGKPTVATAVSDIPEALEGCGWVVPPGDPSALRDAIDEALDDPVEAARRGQAARQRAIERFSWDAMQSALRPLFDELDGAIRRRRLA